MNTEFENQQKIRQQFSFITDLFASSLGLFFLAFDDVFDCLEDVLSDGATVLVGHLHHKGQLARVK